MKRRFSLQPSVMRRRPAADISRSLSRSNLVIISILMSDDRLTRSWMLSVKMPPTRSKPSFSIPGFALVFRCFPRWQISRLFRPKQSLWAVVCKSTEEICGENGRPLLFRTEKQASGFRRSLKTPRRVAVSRVTFGIVFTEPEPSELLVELTPRYRAQAIRRFWNYVCLNGLAPAGLVSSSEGADPLLYLRLR